MTRKQKPAMTCQNHRSYLAKYAPRVECYDCWDIFFQENPRFRRLVEVLVRNEQS